MASAGGMTVSEQFCQGDRVAHDQVGQPAHQTDGHEQGACHGAAPRQEGEPGHRAGKQHFGGAPLPFPAEQGRRQQRGGDRPEEPGVGEGAFHLAWRQ